MCSGQGGCKRPTRFLHGNWDGPVVLKGIQAVKDADAAMDAHMDGIIVVETWYVLPMSRRVGESMPACP
jgi:hypothetical protein